MTNRDGDHRRIFQQYYEINKDRFDGFLKLTERLALIISRGIAIEHVGGRVKKLDKCLTKLEEKYAKKVTDGADCRQLVTDIIGFRFVCLYADDIPAVQDRLSDFFHFTPADITDKIQELENVKEAFGYRALHIDARLNEQRAKLEEYSEYSDLRIEFQIRTVAQDAWASIERTIGYRQNVPKKVRRRFAILAALLELADKEFLEIRNEIASHGESSASS